MTRLFLFCLGLFVASTFCMKRIEKDVYGSAPGLSVMKLELTYSRQEVSTAFQQADESDKQKLRYVLIFDFIFMVGCFPGIAMLCLMLRKKYRSAGIRFVLLGFALLQVPAWAFDIYENICLLQWSRDPVIGENFGLYRLLVQLKWLLALGGVAAWLVFSVFLLFKKKESESGK